jgi:general secretion pathway protein D
VIKAPGAPSDFIIGRDPKRPTDRFVTRLFSLQYINVRDIQTQLSSLARTTPNAFQFFPASGMILVTDYDYNVEKYAKLIEAIDIPRPDIVMEVIQLKNALATEAEIMLNSLLEVILKRPTRPGLPAGQQEPLKIVADKRTNSLIILAEPQRMVQVKTLVKAIDAELGVPTSGIYVYHLKHTNAEDMAKTIAAAYGTTPGARPTVPARPGAPTPGAPPVPARGVPGVGPPPIIIPDVATNSLIIVTDRNTYKEIEKLIQRLDQRKPQVLIKASIVEITGAESLDLGIEYGIVKEPREGDYTPFGATFFGVTTIDPQTGIRRPVSATGVILGILKDKIGNIATILKALKSTSRFNVLSEPEVVTNDNVQATIEIRDRVPYKTVTVTGTGIAQEQYHFADAITTLSITPHISEAFYLRLDTHLKIEKFGVPVEATAPPPATGKELKTSITVPNGRTIVIGGLVVDEERQTVTGAPFISDIPILGHLFKYTEKQREKRTLYLFITPYILFDERFGDIYELTRKRKIFAERWRKKPLDLPIEVLPEPKPRTTYRPKLLDKPPR